MFRQQRRRIERSWNKKRSIVDCVRDCFCCAKPHPCDCTGKVTIVDLPYTAVEKLIKVSKDLMLRYNLDMFRRWRMIPIVVVAGFFWQGSGYNIGVASDEWLDEYFGESDEDFEFGCE